MKGYATVIMLAGLAAAAVWVPVGPAPANRDRPGADPPAVAICPAVQGQGRSTTVDLLSTVPGSGRFTAFASGAATGNVQFDVDDAGSAHVAVIDVSAVGVVGGLAELPESSSAASSVIVGADSLAAESCASVPSQETLLVGGSTLSDEGMEIQLMNPYAGEASVTLTVVSESGIETNESFDNVLVPSLSTTIIDLAEILPGRRVLSVSIETRSGSVIPVGRFDDGSDSALWNAIAPGQEWYVVVPGGSGRREIIIASSSPGDVSYQLDLYGPEGLTEGFGEGVIPGRGTVSIDMAEISTSPAALRIFASGPVVPVLRFEPETGVALTTGAPVPAARWLLPGSGSLQGGLTRLLILNPSNADANVSVGGSGLEPGRLTVTPGSVSPYLVPERIVDGLFVESDMPVVVVWTMRSGDTFAMSGGVGLDDG